MYVHTGCPAKIPIPNSSHFPPKSRLKMVLPLSSSQPKKPIASTASASSSAGMASSAPPGRNPSNVYQIGGTPVDFPYKPYGSQLAFMGRVISTLDRAHRQGHCHALLESPTGTGKSLSLLCSTLAWQKHFATKCFPHFPPMPAADPRACLDPLAFGGGFVPEPEPSGNTTPEKLNQSAPAATNSTQMACKMPKIYYASRTHSQISQAIGEYRKTSYRVPIAVLASRKHYCTNTNVCGNENVDDECKKLIKGNDVQCSEFKNVHKVKGHSSLQKGGCHEVHDIEDLVKIGKTVKGCSYFAARSMAEEAQLVFCPYNYIISPIIRKAMEVDLRGAVVIFDEAHNIEDISRDAGSLDVEDDILDALLVELGQLSENESAAIYQPLYDMIEGIVSWMGRKKNDLKKHEFEHYFSCWTGERALSELREAGITQEYFPILQECAVQAMKDASDAEVDGMYLGGRSAAILEGLFSTLGYLLSENGIHAHDYQIALQRYVKRDASHVASGWMYSLNIWCLNPAVVFREIANLSLSVILTSGTLSPMGSFASELGVQFETCMEAPHVIDVESQLWAALISTGPGNCRLNASYKTADGFAFQDAVGASLEEICKVVPGGALVFFPSYKMLEKLQARWTQTGVWSRLNAQKALFVEPRGKNEDFESILKGYYDAIQGQTSKRRAAYKVKKEPKQGSRKLKELSPVSGNGEAAFLAVCRGKVSEGINFSDENARVVVIVGIPFPNKNDIQITLKKKYNDTFKSTKRLLSGSQWYCYQAFRALNQAAGRCIRHRFDYGAIIFLDERYVEERNRAYISKWLRNSIKQYSSFDETINKLRNYFLEAKERFSRTSMEVMTAMIESTTVNKEEKPSVVKQISKKAPVKRIRKWDKPNDCGGAEAKVVPVCKTTSMVAGVSLTSFQKNLEPHFGKKFEGNFPSEPVKQSQRTCKECIDLSCLPQKDVRSSEVKQMEFYTRSMDCYEVVENFKSNSEVETPHSTVLQGCNDSSVQPSFPTMSPTSSNRVSSEGSGILEATPERKNSAESGSSLNNSVNSYSQKRRPLVNLHPCNHNKLDLCVSLEAETKNSNQGTASSSQPFTKSKHQRVDIMKMAQRNIVNIVLDKKLEICCLSCKNRLGLPDNNYYITCSLMPSAKSYLVTYRRSRSTGNCSPDPLPVNNHKSQAVIVTDISYIDERVIKHSGVGLSPHDVWCEEDGCVYRPISCFSCPTSDAYLGLQVIAADAANNQLLNKVFFYHDRLHVKELELEEKPVLPVSNLTTSQAPGWVSIEKYSYTPQLNLTSGLTKSKMRLPKKATV